VDFSKHHYLKIIKNRSALNVGDFLLRIRHGQTFNLKNKNKKREQERQ